MRLHKFKYDCRQSGINQRLVSTFWAQCRNAFAFAFVCACVEMCVCMHVCMFIKYIVSTHTPNYPFKQTQEHL